MAEYTNQLNVNLSEVCTLQFRHITKREIEEAKIVAEIVMHIDAAENFAQHILDTIIKAKENAVQIKKTLS